jgi:hypothetical protein
MATSKSTIDYSAYRSDALARSIGDLVNVRGIYAGVFLKTLAVTLILIVIVGAFFWSRANLPLLAIVLLYTLFAGGVIGVLLAIVQVIQKSLNNMQEIVARLLELTIQIATDFRAIQSGESELPSARELVLGTYRQIILPVVEQAITDQLWVFGRPILFLYRMTLGRLVNLAIHVIPDRMIERQTGRSLESVRDETLRAMEQVTNREDRIVAALKWTEAKISHLSRWGRFLVVFPCLTLSVLVAISILIPLIILWMTLGQQFTPPAPVDPDGTPAAVISVFGFPDR